MRKDIHSPALVVEHRPGLFARLHISGGIRYELAEGNLAVFREGVATVLRACPFRHIHKFGPVIADLRIDRRQFPFGDGDAQYIRQHRLPRRRGRQLLIALDPMVPLDDELAAPNDREAVLAVFYALVQPDFGFVQAVRIEAGLIRGDRLPVILWKCHGGQWLAPSVVAQSPPSISSSDFILLDIIPVDIHPQPRPLGDVDKTLLVHQFAVLVQPRGGLVEVDEGV